MATDDQAVLRRALDQLAELLDDVPDAALGDPTPCHPWTVQDLVDHIVEAPDRFARMARGESIDWAAPTPSAGPEPAARFRANADGLMRVMGDAEGGVPVDWQCAELAVHTWDLTTALGRSTAGLDPEVAESGLAFMRANMTDDKRAPAFGPEQPAPDGADAYQRAAAFAGRPV
jgi:uncharacterized protein (TIGR03083 family)